MARKLLYIKIDRPMVIASHVLIVTTHLYIQLYLSRKGGEWTMQTNPYGAAIAVDSADFISKQIVRQYINKDLGNL